MPQRVVVSFSVQWGFSIFERNMEHAINERKEYCTGIKANGVRIQTLRFSDGTAILAQDEINLKRALESLDDILKSI